MKVKDLITALQEIPQDYDVIISSDSEGNNFGPFSAFSVGMYVPETTWYGYLRDADYSYEDKDPYIENAVVFWPVN